MKNQNSKSKINIKIVKKIVFTVIAIILISIIAYTVNYFINKSKREYSIEEVKEFNYYLVRQDGKYGVIDRTGNLVVTNEYEDIIIPNPEKPVFICIYNYNLENGEYDTKILNNEGKEIFTEYEEVEAIALKNLITEVPYEKSVLKYKKDGKYGLIDYTGKVITKPIYEEIDNLLYKEGELLVKQDGKYGVINIKGVTLLKPEYDSIACDGYYNNDSKYGKDGYIVSVKTDEGYRYGYIDYTGKLLLKMEYNDIYRINNIKESEDIYLVTQRNGQSGLMKNDRQILNNQYQSIEFDDQTELLILEKNKKYGISKLSGTSILGIDYTSITIEGIYIYADKDNQSTIYDLNGNKQSTIKFKDIIDIEKQDVKITVDINGKYGMIDENGKIIVSNKYYYLEQLFDKYFIAVAEEGKVGIIDNRDDEILPINYDVIQRIGNTNLIEAYNKTTGILEIYDNTITKLANLDNATMQQEDNYIKLYSDTDTIYLGLDGKEIKNTEVFPNNELYAVKQNGKWGFADKSGNIKVECIYDKVTDLNKYGFAGIRLGNKWGVVNKSGEIIVEPKYTLDSENGEPDFIGQYYKVVSGYSEIYYTNELSDIEE